MTQPRRILLIVDDDAIARRTLSRTLQDTSYDILQAEGPEDAFALLAAHEVSVVISDHHMKGALGTTFLSEVETRYPKAVRILLTSDTSTQVFVGAINDGHARRVLYKPWADDQIRSVVRQAMGMPKQRAASSPGVYTLKPLSSGTLTRIKAMFGVPTAE